MALSGSSLEPLAIRAALAKAEKLAVFPPAARRILQVVDDPDTSLVDLEQAVAMDPVLAGVVMKIANSSFFGLSRRVTSLRHALFVLGFSTTREMALALATLSVAGRDESRWRKVWLDSLETALCMRLLVELIGSDGRADCFSVGLLHRIGMLLMLTLHRREYGTILDAAGDDDDLLVEGERCRYGYDHMALGAACLERWRLPEDYCLAVRYQGRPGRLLGRPGPGRLSSLLWLARRLRRDVHGERRGAKLVAELAESGPARQLGLGAAALDSALARLPAVLAEVGDQIRM